MTSVPRLRVGLVSLVAQLALVTYSAPAIADEPPDFTIHTTDSKDIVAPLKKIDSTGNIRIGGTQPTLLDADRVITMRRVMPPVPDKNMVLLANGDILTLAADGKLTLGDDVFHLECPELRRKNGLAVRVPLTFASILWFAAPNGSDEDAVLFVRQLQQGKRTEDVVLLRNGDRIEGSVSTIDADSTCVVAVRARKTTIPLTQIAAIAFNSELRARIQPRKAYSHLVLKDGTRLGLASLELPANSVDVFGKTFFGEQIQAPLEQVAAIDYRLGSAVYLSDLEPKSYEHTPFLGVRWPLLRDASVNGRPLQLGAHTYDKGLGMRPRAVVTYTLDGKYRRFEATVGLDAQSQYGSARVQVLIDGKELSEPFRREVLAREVPMPVRIDVRKARELTLLADFADFGAVQADVDWGDARLIR